MKRLLILLLFCPSLLFGQSKTKADSAKAKPAIDSVKAKNDSLKAWKVNGNFSLNLTQASFTNWAAGGENSFSGATLFGIAACYKKNCSTWDNNLDLAYGLMEQGFNNMARKTDDKIDFSSKFGYCAYKKVLTYTALLGFKSQFMPGYNYLSDTSRILISDFLAPGYAMLALGMEYKPVKTFSVMVSPLTGRLTIVNNQMLADQGAFGVKKAEYDTSGNKTRDGMRLREEFGGYVRLQYKGDIMKNVNLAAKLEFFSNYLHNPQNIVVNAEALLNMKVNKYISATLNMQAIYDNDINIAVDKNHDGIVDANGPRLQFKEVLGIGFSTKF